MLDVLRRDKPSVAAAYFAGSTPPPLDGVARLRDLGYELTERRAADDAVWALELRWFEAHAIGTSTIDATLENRPFDVDLRPGERAERPLDLLTDWMLMTPEGQVTPRSQAAARRLREARGG